MDFLEKAKQLQQERLEKERQERDQQAKSQQDAAARQQQLAAIARQKTEELLPLFKKFYGFKIANGHASLDAEVTRTPNGDGLIAILKAGAIDSSVLHQFSFGMPLLVARYDAEQNSYGLQVCDHGRRGAMRTAGSYKTVDDLMNAIAEEVAKL